MAFILNYVTYAPVQADTAVNDFRCKKQGVSSDAEKVQVIRLRFLCERNSFIDTIYKVFKRQVEDRCGAVVKTFGEGQFTIELGIDKTIGLEGFRIESVPTGTVRILGNNEQGILYGIGKFLRTSRYDCRGFTPGLWRGTLVPIGTVRGVYLATHFNNAYVAAPAHEIERYIEDLSLWGINAFKFAFPIDYFDSIQDADAQAYFDMLRALTKAAKRVGMKVAIGVVNGGLKSAPADIRHTPVPDDLGRRGQAGVMICPSNPRGCDYLLEKWQQVFDEFSETGLDHVLFWPYDEGGCGCEQCWPWGYRGFVHMTKMFAPIIRDKFPGCKIILSTWTYDTPPVGEWEGLSQAVAKDKSWLDYIMADSHTDFPRYPLDQGVPGDLPLINFPEISMWGQIPWGGFGTNPLPGRLQRLWDQTEGKVSGGFVYSEGIYEDINKIISVQYYWNPKTTAEDTVKEYISFEYSHDVVDDVWKAVQILESNHQRENIQSTCNTAFAILDKVNDKLFIRRKNAWRWRILYLRSLIDKEIYKQKGQKGSVLKEAFDELTEIYHAQNAWPRVHPPVIE